MNRFLAKLPDIFFRIIYRKYTINTVLKYHMNRNFLQKYLRNRFACEKPVRVGGTGSRLMFSYGALFVL